MPHPRRPHWPRLLLITAAAALHTLAAAQAPAPAAPAASAPRIAPLLTFQRVLDRPDRPQPQQRIAYGTAAQQVGELWLPPAERFGPGPYPVVLMVHGGCWMAELPGPELLAWQAEALRQRGVAVWSISYRRLGHEGGGYPGTFQDVARGADHLRELAAAHRLDLSRVTATGHSAGGHLALWLAARPNLPAGSPLHSATPLPVQRVVGVAGVGDLAWASPFIGAVCSPDVAPRLVNEGQRGKEAWADTSPAAMAPLRVPVTMVSGVYDAIVPPAHGRRFAQVMGNRGGAAVTLQNLDDAGHFELIAPWTPAGAATVDTIVGR